MQVALVQCPPWGALPPLGTAALKAYLEQHGHQARCIDLNIAYCNERRHDLIDETLGSIYARPDPWASEAFDEWSFEFADDEVQFRSGLADHPLPVDEWAALVLETRPRVVGFSVQYTNLGVTLQVAQAVRRADPGVFIVFGGPNVAQDQSGRLALETGVPDVVVEGEGEETLLELLDVVEHGLDLAAVRGIGRLVGGRARWTERRPLIADVDSIPFPDFSDVDWTAYPNPFEIPIMTSRGCVLSCAFCYETVYWKRYRTQSPERIVAEIEHQVAHHPLGHLRADGLARFDFSFADSLVNGHLGGLRRMAQMLVDREVGICWNGQATVNTKMGDDFFELLAASGCTGLSFGLESASQPVLESMGKHFKIDEAVPFFERVHRSGIKVIVNVMVGFPTETRADFIETLRFLARIRGLIFMVNNVSPTGVPSGSRIHQDPAAFGVTPVDITGWADGSEVRWTSEASGTEADRYRRLRILHRWMQVARIPHQRLPERHRRVRLRRRRRHSPEDRTWLTLPEEAPPADPQVASRVGWSDEHRLDRAAADRALADFAASASVPPVVFHAIDQVIDAVLDSPPWAGSLDPSAWVGRGVQDLKSVMASRFGDDLTIEAAQRDDGTVEARVRSADATDGVRVAVLPPEDGELGHRIAVLPLDLEADALS